MTTSLAEIKKGDILEFTEYEDEPEEGVMLEPGAICEVKSIEKDADGITFVVMTDNPEFDASKKETTKNPKQVQVELFDSEVSVVEKPKPKAKSRSKTKAKAKTIPTTDTVAAKAEAETKPKVKARVKPEVAEESKEVTTYEPEWGNLKNEDAEILAVVNEQGDNLIEYTKELLEARSSASYQVGAMLYHIQLTGDYQKLSPDYEGGKGFMAFVETELDFGYRSAKYLIDIYTTFNKYSLGHKVSEIGWTKATKIVEATHKHAKANEGKDMTKAEVNKLLTKAKNSTVKELQESIDEMYKTDDANKVKFHVIKISLPEERAEIVEDIIKRAMEHFDTESMGVAIENALTEWSTEMLE